MKKQRLSQHGGKPPTSVAKPAISQPAADNEDFGSPISSSTARIPSTLAQKFRAADVAYSGSPGAVTVTFGDLTVVPVDGTQTISYSTSPPEGTATATLQTISGDGVATFDNGGKSTDLTGTGTLTIRGVAVSSEMNNIWLAAGASVDFTVVKIDLAIIHPGTGEVSEDDEETKGLVAIKRSESTPVTKLKLKKIRDC